MHGHNGKGDNSMMWMMVICCALPLALVLLSGSTPVFEGTMRYVVIGAVVFMCLWMMFKGHGHTVSPDKADTNIKENRHE